MRWEYRRNCSECQKQNKLFEILRILQWRGANNYLTALSYDRETETILINKDYLMRAIQLANPGQAYRNIRLVEHEEFVKLGRGRSSDNTAWKLREEK